MSNWSCLKTISAYAFFWSIGTYLCKESDLVSFNDIACEIIKKSACVLNPDRLKLFESEIDIKSNSLVPFQKDLSLLNTKDHIIVDYLYQASLVKLCMDNLQPCLIYGHVGVGKSSLVEKMLLSRYDYSRISSIEPGDHVQKTLMRNIPFIKAKKYPSINNYSNNYVFVIEDLNVNYAPRRRSTQSSSSMELARQIMETRTLGPSEEGDHIGLEHVVLLFTCSFCGNSPNYMPLSERLTKSLINVNLNPNPSSFIESVFFSPIQQWLEEFPSESVLYPNELAHVRKIEIS